MARTAFWFMFVGLAAPGGNASDSQQPPAISVQARERIRVLADPYLMDILLPERTDVVRVPLSSVPERARKEALLWIPRVVQERWLPADFQEKLIGLKDVKHWERKNKEGIVVYEDIGDFLVLDHEMSGYGIHIQESGGSVSLRVDLPEVMPVADDPSAFIRKCLTDFLNIPPGLVPQLQGDLKQELPVYFASLRSPRVIARDLAIRELGRQTPPGESFEINDELRAQARQWQWWDRVRVCTDGRFFFVKVLEAEPGRRPRPRPGLPNRF